MFYTLRGFLCYLCAAHTCGNVRWEFVFQAVPAWDCKLSCPAVRMLTTLILYVEPLAWEPICSALRSTPPPSPTPPLTAPPKSVFLSLLLGLSVSVPRGEKVTFLPTTLHGWALIESWISRRDVPERDDPPGGVLVTQVGLQKAKAFQSTVTGCYPSKHFSAFLPRSTKNGKKIKK